MGLGLLALTAAAPAAHAVTFSAPASVASSKEASRFAVAANARGQQAFAWEVTREVSPAPRFRQVTFIRARLRTATGRLGRTQRLRAGHAGFNPDVAIAPDGTAIVVWSRVVDGHFRIFAAVRRPGGGFGRGRAIGRTDKRLGALPRVEFDLRGNAIVLWRWSDRLQWASRAPGRNFRSARTIRIGSAAQRVPTLEKQLAFDRQRNAYVVIASSGRLRRAQGGGLETIVPGGIFLSVRERGAARFGSPRRVSPAGVPASKPQVGSASGGEVIVVWRDSATPGAEDDRGRILAAAVTNGRAGPPQALTVPGQEAATDPVLGVGPGGEATAAWVQPPLPGTAPGVPDLDQVAASVRPAGGSFGVPVVLSGLGIQSSFPSVAVTDRGTAVALWQEQAGGTGSLMAAARPQGGVFGPAAQVARPASFPAYGHAGNRLAAVFGAESSFRAVDGTDP